MEDDNTVVVKGISYTKLECVGRGGSSKVRPQWSRGGAGFLLLNPRGLDEISKIVLNPEQDEGTPH